LDAWWARLERDRFILLLDELKPGVELLSDELFVCSPCEDPLRLIPDVDAFRLCEDDVKLSPCEDELKLSPCEDPVRPWEDPLRLKL